MPERDRILGPADDEPEVVPHELVVLVCPGCGWAILAANGVDGQPCERYLEDETMDGSCGPVELLAYLHPDLPSPAPVGETRDEKAWLDVQALSFHIANALAITTGVGWSREVIVTALEDWQRYMHPAWASPVPADGEERYVDGYAEAVDDVHAALPRFLAEDPSIRRALAEALHEVMDRPLYKGSWDELPESLRVAHHIDAEAVLQRVAARLSSGEGVPDE